MSMKNACLLARLPINISRLCIQGLLDCKPFKQARLPPLNSTICFNLQASKPRLLHLKQGPKTLSIVFYTLLLPLKEDLCVVFLKRAYEHYFWPVHKLEPNDFTSHCKWARSCLAAGYVRSRGTPTRSLKCAAATATTLGRSAGRSPAFSNPLNRA